MPKITFLGTGDAFCGGGRGNSAYLVEDGARRVLVDCGATVPLALRRRGIAGDAIEEVLITHLHGDHAAGLPFLELSGRYETPGRPPLRITGPAGTARFVEEMYARLYPEVAHRPRPFALEVREIAPGDRVLGPGYALEALQARHMKAPWVALMLRLEIGGRLLAFTGDTGPEAPLGDLARGAHLLVSECTFPSPAEGGPPLPAGTHLSVADLRRERPRWDARRVLLTHLSAPSREEARSLAGVEVADDGLEVEV